VLQVIAPAPYGGAETALLSLTQGLQAARVPVVLAVMADARSGPFIARARGLGVPVEVLDSPARNYLRDLRELRRVIRTYGVTVVHSHGYRADVLGSVAARSLGSAHVATAHGFTGGSARNRLNQAVGLWALRHADAVIAVSAAMAETLQIRGVPASRVRVIQNAWTLPGRPLSQAAARARLALGDGRWIGWVGRLSGEKGPDLALGTLEGLSRVQMAFVGDGPLRASLVEQAGREGVASRLSWLGVVPDVWEVLPAFDLLLLSSRTEGTPMIVLEAMLAGVPVVATPVGGVPALVSRETGWLASEVSSGAIREAVAQALAQPEEAKARAERATAIHGGERFGEYLRAHRNTYEAAVAGRRR